jgi:predicted nucleic acid-binding protein
MSYIVDTNIFNQLIDGSVAISDLPSDSLFFATHVQIDEINNTKDSERRAQLFFMFVELKTEIVPTESFVFDISRFDLSKLSDGVLFGKLKHDLDMLNKSKSNNPQDVLIAEVAIMNGYTLITADRDLADVVEKHGGKIIYTGKKNEK